MVKQGLAGFRNIQNLNDQFGKEYVDINVRNQMTRMAKIQLRQNTKLSFGINSKRKGTIKIYKRSNTTATWQI